MARRLLEDGSMARLGGATRRARARGFTLIELAVVVVIVGVLAVIALVAYRKIITSSRVTEAKNMLGSIRLAEEDYKAENGAYYNAATYCPVGAGTGTVKVQWDATCGGAAPPGWGGMTVHTDGPVLFQYAALAPGGNVGQAGLPVTLIDVSAYAGQNRPWYLAHARADMDPGGLVTQLAATNLDNGIRVINEGE